MPGGIQHGFKAIIVGALILAGTSILGWIPHTRGQDRPQAAQGAITASQKLTPGPLDFHRTRDPNGEFASFYDFVKPDGDHMVRNPTDLRDAKIVAHFGDELPEGAEVEVSLYPVNTSLNSQNSLIRTKGQDGLYRVHIFNVTADHTITIDVANVGIAPEYLQEYLSKVVRIAVHSRQAWGVFLSPVEAKVLYFELSFNPKIRAFNIGRSPEKDSMAVLDLQNNILTLIDRGRLILHGLSGFSALPNYSDKRTLSAA